MTPSNQAVTLHQRDVDVLNALVEDRAESGRGLTRAELASIAATRWPDHVLRRLREAGHWLASIGTGEEDERWHLLDDLPSTGASDDGERSEEGQDSSGASSGIPVGGRLFELPSVPHYDVRAEAA